MEWPRETAWRQGRFLDQKHFEALGLGDEKCLLVAISHDCDIASSVCTEPYIEFVRVNIIAKADGNFLYGKNPRKLHLAVSFRGNQNVCLEFLGSQKFTIPKESLCHISPSDDYCLSGSDKDILQTWLAVRYKRHALPDSLNDRLKPFFSSLISQGKKASSEIVAIYIDYEPREVELPSDEHYELIVNFVYSIDDPASRNKAISLAGGLRDSFDDLMKKSSDSGKVDLQGMEAYSEEEFTLRDTRTNIRLQLDYLSFRGEPFGPLAD